MNTIPASRLPAEPDIQPIPGRRPGTSVALLPLPLDVPVHEDRPLAIVAQHRGSRHDVILGLELVSVTELAGLAWHGKTWAVRIQGQSLAGRIDRP